MASPFPPKLQVKTYGLNIQKILCNRSIHFVYLNSLQLVNGLSSVKKHGHHSWAYFEGLTKFWGSSVYSSPPYSTYCTLKIHTFGPKHLLHPNPTHSWNDHARAARCVPGTILQPVIYLKILDEVRGISQSSDVNNQCQSQIGNYLHRWKYLPCHPFFFVSDYPPLLLMSMWEDFNIGPSVYKHYHLHCNQWNYSTCSLMIQIL